jgi:hypothetical protein
METRTVDIVIDRRTVRLAAGRFEILAGCGDAARGLGYR